MRIIKVVCYEKVHHSYSSYHWFLRINVCGPCINRPHNNNCISWGRVFSTSSGYLFANPSHQESNFSIWWSLPDDATRAEILATYISNFLVCGAICGSAFQLPKEHLSEIPIVYFATVPIVVAVIACLVRRIIVKHNN